MSCRHWNKETFFCNLKKKEIVPEQISVCEECSHYRIIDEEDEVFCTACQKLFRLTKDQEVFIKGKEFAKCPTCGEVSGIDRDNEILT